MSIKKGLVNPDFCVFVGTPVNWAEKNKINVKKLLKNYNIPTLFIQNSEDYVISFKDLNQFLEDNNVKNKKLVELDGNNHKYEHLKVLKKEIENFINEIKNVND